MEHIYPEQLEREERCEGLKRGVEGLMMMSPRYFGIPSKPIIRPSPVSVIPQTKGFNLTKFSKSFFERKNFVI
jgi:hypothetical protein